MIRHATAADLPALLALERSAPGAAHWSAEQYRDLFASAPRVALILEQEEIVGFLIGRGIGPEWEIENVAVLGSLRRRGVGSRLVAEFVSLARESGASSIHLEVRESNLAARRLYEKLGFVESGRRKGYYQDPEEDAVLCSLTA